MLSNHVLKTLVVSVKISITKLLIYAAVFLQYLVKPLII